MDVVNQLSDAPNDLASCEREPLQFIGSIQGIGCLIAFTINDRRIQAASENINDLIGISHQEVVSAKLEHVLTPGITERVSNCVRELTPEKNRANFTFQLDDRRFDGAVFVTDGLGFIEFEESGETASYADLVKDALIDLRSSRDLVKSAAIVCRAVQAITGMDRVMMYRFLEPHHHGEVIAEHRVLSAHSFYQHRFPASDIPQIARDLYLKNNVRQIPDVDLPIVAVSPGKNPLNGRDLDLSDSRLRAVSPIHLEYLRNMKVRCSFSVAVIVDGALWGLVACHHLNAKRIPLTQRTACEMVANAFAGQARLIEDTETQNRRIDFLTNLSGIFETIFTSRHAENELLLRHQAIFETFRATGVAVVRGSRVDAAGQCPPRADLLVFAAQFLEAMNDRRVDLIATDSIAIDFPNLTQHPGLACGVLGVKISDDSLAILFRPEQIQTIIWGGDPRKQLDRKKFEGRINPRTSFETWQETIGLRSIPWAPYETEGFQRLKDLIFEKLARRP